MLRNFLRNKRKRTRKKSKETNNNFIIFYLGIRRDEVSILLFNKVILTFPECSLGSYLLDQFAKLVYEKKGSTSRPMKKKVSGADVLAAVGLPEDVRESACSSIAVSRRLEESTAEEREVD